ncbi:MAG: hypothetical protein ACE5IR_21865 [bacterium]
MKNHQDSGERWVEAPLEELKVAKGQIIEAMRLLKIDEYCQGIQFEFNSGFLNVTNIDDDVEISNHENPYFRIHSITGQEPEWIDI